MRKKRTFSLILLDIILINLSYFLALYVRFDGQIADAQFMHYLEIYMQHFIFITAIKLITLIVFKVYKCSLRYASISDLINIATATITANGLVIFYLFIRGASLPRSIHIIAILLDIILIGGVRFSIRAFDILSRVLSNEKEKKRIMIVGAGDAGDKVIREYRNHADLNSKPIILIDDDLKMLGQTVNGVEVRGSSDKIPYFVKQLKIDEIVIAIPTATESQTREIVRIAKSTDAKVKTLPPLFELIDGEVSLNKIRDVQLEDLLGREEIKVDLKNISSYITGRTVMVTGGGGSIGSELCRQIVKFKPKRLIIFDIYENSIYDIENELNRAKKNIDLVAYIGSIRDKSRVDHIMESEKPEVVFHAAAHKHVPLMEVSPKEAIKNNVFGTLNLVQAADQFGVNRFVMISTDKAVNPTNIMGASKRICEMIIQSINLKSTTDFVAVRFGNVLGSNGSVIPLFKKQIEEGGPVTVTHPEIIRYFMTIPEAVQLVIEAGSMAKGGEIFVLDMGDPVKILDLAKDLIHLSGYEPNVDMDIVFTGLRPGEKLYEELLLDDEGISDTSHDKIFIGKPIFTDYELMLEKLDELKGIIEKGSEEEVKLYVQSIVTNYTIKDESEVVKAESF